MSEYKAEQKLPFEWSLSKTTKGEHQILSGDV